jgi:hypothetical protein
VTACLLGLALAAFCSCGVNCVRLPDRNEEPGLFEMAVQWCRRVLRL